MPNQLEMAEIHAILTLDARSGSSRRIARELEVHRQTVARCVRRAAAYNGPAPSKPPQPPLAPALPQILSAPASPSLNPSIP